jgi:uncharacterized membrane protein
MIHSKIILMSKTKIDRKRHIFKAITWRIIASLTTFMITYLVTKDVSSGTIVGVFDFVIKMVLYYYHERVWYRINFGIEHKRRLVKRRRLYRKIKKYFNGN